MKLLIKSEFYRSPRASIRRLNRTGFKNKKASERGTAQYHVKRAKFHRDAAALYHKAGNMKLAVRHQNMSVGHTIKMQQARKLKKSLVLKGPKAKLYRTALARQEEADSMKRRGQHAGLRGHKYDAKVKAAKTARSKVGIKHLQRFDAVMAKKKRAGL